MAALELTQIGKRFGKHLALNEVSLKVNSGEFICLLGASGCGKTTLLRIIAGLEQHDHGEILLDGRDLSRVPCHRRNIGMVFQSLALFPHINVGENIAYGLKMRGVDTVQRCTRSMQLLELVGLSGFEDRTVSSLSGGQRQRVAIARALALEPQLFLMDEPFSALDAALRDHLQLEVRKLQQSLGVTTVFVTHDQREAMALADRIVILNEGRVEQAATPAEIYKHPASRFVAEFIGNNNLLTLDLSASEVRLGNALLGVPAGVVAGLRGQHCLAVRPEEVTINDITTHNSAVTGQVVMQRQIGALMEREIDVGGQIIKQTSFQNDMTRVDTGKQVSVSWDWSKVWVLPG